MSADKMLIMAKHLASVKQKISISGLQLPG
jgi:hypothetical protein